MKLVYITNVKYILDLHDRIIEISGGLAGVKNQGYLESPLAHIQNDLYYPEFEDKLTHLVFSINKFHSFEDGNKRTSVAIGAQFLEINGFGYIVSKFIREMENIAVCVADDVIDKDFLKEIISSIIYEDDYDESLKIKIADALLKQIEKEKIQKELFENEDDLF